MGALLFVIGVLIAFALMMGVFLILPFFLFLAGIVAMMVSDRRREKKTSDEEAEAVEPVEVVESDSASARPVVR
jgi:uncharacterized membrane protein